jgi:PiT family inorganic phosphate transporter
MNPTYLADAVSEKIGTGLTATSVCLLVAAIGLALAFEFVNGFHDTANAVATVIYTRTMKPWFAVVWSGCFNLIGVLIGGGGVAYAILELLPPEMVTHVSSAAGFVMIFSILISAILWNLGTWYLGLPASSSHTLIGSIVGVGLANSLLSGHRFGDGVNWAKVWDAFLSLLISPVVGFVGAGLLLVVAKKFVRWPALYKAPEGDRPPPASVRALLTLSCTGVSLGHGANDGSKGMGLLLLILIGILPGQYALNTATTPVEIRKMQAAASVVGTGLMTGKPVTFTGSGAADELDTFLQGKREFDARTVPAFAAVAHDISVTLSKTQSLAALPVVERERLRNELYLSSAAASRLLHDKRVTSDSGVAMLKDYQKNCLNPATHNIPFWVKLATAVSLGLGTMIGWKRIVVTVGEKIGKQHLTYAEGAAAELVAAATIGIAQFRSMPVSTTHVLSSGVAGTMTANGAGVQAATVRNILLAWVLTLPVCVLLGAGLFAAGLELALNNMIPVTIGVVAVVGTSLALWRVRHLFAATQRFPATA